MPNTVMRVTLFLIVIITLAPESRAFGFDWHTTELHGQYGKLDTPTFAGGGSSTTRKLTLQHADGYKFGDNFFFVDFISSSDPDFEDDNVYGEFYTNLSYNKLRKAEMWSGPLKDIGFTAGYNFSHDAKVHKYLPGIRFDLNIPTFNMAKLLFTGYIDDNRGIAHGGAPKEDDSYMIDFAFARPFAIGKHDFSIEGHVEYIGQRENELGNTVSWHILAQPQFRYDLGKTIFDKPQKLFIGIEAQLWINKLGDRDTDEFAPQALIVWRF